MGRPGRILLGLLCVYAAAVLTPAISRTVYVQQDAAYYSEVAQRFADSEGLTSLSDRRGPAAPRAFPQPYEANTWFPLLLGTLTLATGDAENTGAALSLAALLGSLVLGSICLTRWLGIAGIPAVLGVAAALFHRDSLRGAVLPLTDSLSMFLNIAVACALMAKRIQWGAGLVVLAIATRYQNVALLLPLVWMWPEGRDWAPGFRRGLILAVAAATLAMGGARLLEGSAVFLNFFHRDSLWRGVRYLGIPLLIGFVAWRGESRLRPLWLLGLGHLLVLLCVPDTSDARPWLFAQRHGLPFHFAAAAVAGVVITRSRGWIYWLSLLAVVIGFGENLKRPMEVLLDRVESTGRPDLVMAESYLREHPLGKDAIVLSQDADVLAYRLGLQSVHLRGFQPDPPQEFLRDLPGRSITHVMLSWENKSALQHRVQRLESFARVLGPHSEVVAKREDIENRSHFLLLRLTPR